MAGASSRLALPGPSGHMLPLVPSVALRLHLTGRPAFGHGNLKLDHWRLVRGLQSASHEHRTHPVSRLRSRCEGHDPDLWPPNEIR